MLARRVESLPASRENESSASACRPRPELDIPRQKCLDIERRIQILQRAINQASRKTRCDSPSVAG